MALAVFAFTITSVAESNLSPVRKLDTLNVLPTSVESTSWHRPEEALVQDVDESGVYQSFTKTNSSYYDGKDPKDDVLPQPTIGTPSTDAHTDASSTSAESDVDTSDDAPAGDSTETSTPVSEDDAAMDASTGTEEHQASEPSTDASAPSDSPSQSEAPEPAPSEPVTVSAPAAKSDSGASSAESPLQALSRSFFRITDVALSLLPFADVSTSAPVTTVDGSSVPESAGSPTAETSTPESVDAPDMDETPVSEEPANADAGAPEGTPISEHASSDGANETATSSEETAGEPAVTTPSALRATSTDTGITFEHFELPPLEPGQLIRNVQLRMSLAGQVDLPEGVAAPSLEVEYDNGSGWTSAGAVLLDGEVSNALNDGYFLFALPRFLSVDSLEDFKVRVTYRGDQEALKRVFVDSVWLQVDTETFNREVLKERLLPSELAHLTHPSMYEFLGTDVDFARGDVPRFSLKYESQRNAAIRFIRNLFGRDLASLQSVVVRKHSGEPIDVHPDVNVTADGLISLQLSPEDTASLEPGAYSIELSVDEGGKVFTDSFEFQYGLVAINPDQTEYALGATTTIMMGAVSEGGNTLCGADLHLYVIDPAGAVVEVPVTASAACDGNNLVDAPDYEATYVASAPGTYEMYAERIGADGEVMAHADDTFKVVAKQGFTLRRDGPTRINPKYDYPMTFTLTTAKAFTGELVERVPKDFAIVSTDASVRDAGEYQELRFAVSQKAGETMTYAYRFDAPDISPYLYNLGPATLVDDANIVVVRETLDGESAFAEESVTTGTSTVDEASTATTDTTGVMEVSPTEPESDASTADTSPEPDSAAPDTTSETPTPAVDAASEPTTPATSTPTDAPASDAVAPASPAAIPLPSAPVATDTATSTDIVTSPTNATSTVSTATSTGEKASFAEHRAWQIASDATGSMIVLWTSGASIPAGWTCISCAAGNTFFQRFPVGSSTYGNQGGSATHTHTASATVSGTATANVVANGGTGVAIDTHSHTMTPTIGSSSSLPAYRQLRYIQANSAGDPGTIPAGAILIFDGSLPAGWTRYSALDDRYPRGENTVGTNGGSNTHTHTITGSTDAASGSTYSRRNGGTQVSAATDNHTHTISSNTASESLEPPYITVVFATSSVATATPQNAIAMWSDTPPAGWLDRSSSADKPFYNRYIKGNATYGTTGGADTHTPADVLGITTSAAVGTINSRSGGAGAAASHTHNVDVTNFTAAANTPPYTSVIFGKFFGYVPIYDQTAYRWYANQNAQTPTDPWPSGGDDIDESTPIDTTLTPVAVGDVVRLRLQLSVTNSTTTGESFKLQYGTTSADCAAVPTWTDVGQSGSSTAWIGFNNSGVADGGTLSSSTLTNTTALESYEEFNPSVALPSAVPAGGYGEWDYVLKQNGAEAGTNYCFRMVESDGTELFQYTQYPMLVTNAAPDAPAQSKLFDNEAVASTSPWFEWTGTDAEADDMTYEIQVDDDSAFGSVNIDNDTATNFAQFENLSTPADKDPYNNADLIRFKPSSSLANGVTYYWRVRAMDPSGSNAWGSWSATRSFTVDTSVTVSTWFQTTQAQFDTDTLTNAEAEVSGDVRLDNGTSTALYTGSAISTPIDFLDGTVGNSWGSLDLTDSAGLQNSISYTVEYLDESTDTWTAIPSSDLPGNPGLSTLNGDFPLSLGGLDTETYRKIRLVADLGQLNGGSTPFLYDWTVTWGYRVETPATTMPFDNEKVGTTTPTFEFTTTDPQSDDLEYQIQWSTSYAFTASTTRSSSVNAGFVDTANGVDTSPFASGDTIQYTIQPSDALTNGTTYWWRVRARDPLGSNEWSFYADPQSLTVDVTTSVSTWYQTTASQFDTDILSGTVSTAANTATVATTSKETLVAYAEGTQTTPRYRIWDGTTWSTEDSALDVGAAQTWVVTKAAPTRSEYILATLGTDADVNVQVYEDGAWGDLQEVTTSNANTSMRGFDVAYETQSGDALVVYCDGDADPSYYVWNGTSWTSGGNIGLTSGNTCGWVKLISDPTSDEIIAVTRDLDGTSYEARVWDGSAWGNSATWGSMQAAQTTHEGIAAEYEESGDQAVVAVSNGTNSRFQWRAWNGSAWSATANQTLGDDFESGVIARDVGSDNMAICYMDQDGDLGVVRWTGAAWTGQTELYTGWAQGAQFADRPIDCAYEVGGSRDGDLMVLYSTTAALNFQYFDGVGWSVAAAASSIQDSPRVELRRTGDNLLQGIAYDSTNDRYDYTYWNGSTWSARQAIETDGAAGGSPFKEPFMIAPKYPSTSGAVIGDPAIDFYAGSGPYWQTFSWNDAQPGGSTANYQIEYFDGTDWQLVPDALLPGNSSGLTSSPVSLAGILPVATYNMLRPVANLTCNGASCPSLSDWTIEWSAGITISGTAKQFDETTNVTSGSVAVAVNGTLQVGKTGTISGGTWSISNVNTAPGDIVTVFINGANDANEAVAVARYDGVGDMDGLKLYEQHLTLGSNDATSTPFTNADIGSYDFTQDEDLFFDASGSSLDMCAETGCEADRLFVASTTTYAPGGTTDLGNVTNAGTLSLGGNAIRASRSWLNTGTTSAGTSTVTFTATSSAETIDETGAVAASFYNVSFGSTTAGGTWTLLSPLTASNNLTVSRGTLARDGEAITVGGSLVNGATASWTGIGTTTFNGSGTNTWTDSNPTLQNVGRVVVDGTSKTIQLGSNVKAESMKIGADDILDASAGNRDITVLGDWVNQNAFVAHQGEVFMSATTTNHIVTAGGDAFYDLTFNGAGGAWSFTEGDLAVNDNFTVSTGTVTMPTGTTTVAGSWNSAGGTFAHNNGTISMTASGAKTVTASGTPFTNNFYTFALNGSGSLTFLDQNATTTNDFRIKQGSVTLPSGTLSVGGDFANTFGSFSHNSGTVKFTSSSAKTIDTNASFANLSFTGSGSWSFTDASVTAVGSLLVENGTLTLPSGTLTLGGSFSNAATVTHNNGTVLFNSADGGETIDLGTSSLYDMTFQSTTGGWTITSSATTTHNTTLTTAGSFTLAAGETLSVGGTFTNAVGGASTTWTGSTLSLQSGSYSINAKTNAGDEYETLRLRPGAHIKMWNSSAASYDIDPIASLYSEDHAGVDGDLYIFGFYANTGDEYWSYATDFDGTALTASTSRQANVKFASGASASLTGGRFEVVGAAGASTTVGNQGSGTYTVAASAGTTTMNYYDVNDLGSTGISLSGTGTVVSLDHGAFTPAFSGGTALTVASSTIGANPGLQIFGVDFSTTTAISASNVTQTDDTPSSYWWFRSSTGNIDGEAFDDDTGDPGSIRWDDSSLVITVSGHVYADDGVTPLGSPTCDDVTANVRIVVSGGASYTGSCSSADGSYSIPGVVVVGDPVLTVYLDTNGGEHGAVVTRTPTTDISDLDIYENRLTTREEDVAPLTILNMAVYDHDDDADLPFVAATGTLTVFADTELHIASSTTFDPAGDITIGANASGTPFDGSLHIDDNATLLGFATSTITVGGSFTMDQGATFLAASTTVVMNATTTGKTITTPAGQTIGFDTLQFTGVGGGWNINGDISARSGIDVTTGTVSGTGDITVTNGSLSGDGTLSMGSGTTTVETTNTLGGATPWTFANLVLGNGAVTGTTTPGSNATTTVLGKLTIATGHFLDAGGSRWNLAGTGNVFSEQGTFLEGTSTVRYSGTGAANILSTNYYDLEMKAQGGAPTYVATGLGIVVRNDLTVGGATTTKVTFDASDPALDVMGNVVIDSTGTLIGSASAVTTVEGDWDNNGTFTASGGTVTFDGAGASDVFAGGSPFANLTVSAGGSVTIGEPATTTGTFLLSSAGAFSVGSGETLAVGGTFDNRVGGAATTWAGSTLYLYGGGNYTMNASTTADVYGTLRVGAGTEPRMWNSSASTYDVASTGSLYSEDHANVDGDLYIFGSYVKASGTDHWDYATDFDGTPLGSPRTVNVRIASGGSVLYTGGGLSVVGTTTGTTTIENQGSGTYSLRIAGTASTTWSYYRVRDMDSSGLTFSGTPTVSTLSNGDIAVGVAGGSAMTVGGTVITQNPAMNFTNDRFGTTTGVSPAVNVTATGTTVSSWRFTNHTGEIAGEAFDVDPDGDPGYIVWDDSAALITISGHVYSDEGSTVSAACDGATANIALRVAGLTSYATSCDAGTGAFSISGVAFSPNDSLVVYIDGESEKAAAITADPVSNIADMDLYENRVIVRHENTDPLTIDDMAVWDSSDDADIPFTAVSGSPDTLTLPADTKLIVWTGKTFRPGGNVTVPGGGGGAAYDGTLELFANATFDATGAETHTIGGSLIADNGASLDDETSTFVFTTTGAGRTIDTNEDPLYNMTLNGSGSWTVSNAALEVGNDLTVTLGAVTLPAATTTIGGSLLVTGGSFDPNGGTMVFTSSGAESINAATSSFAGLAILGSGNFTMGGASATATKGVEIDQGTLMSVSGTFSIGESFENVGGSFTHNNGTLRFTSATGATVTASGSDLGSVTFAGAGAHVFTDANLALRGSLRIEAGSVQLPLGTMSVGGSFVNSGGSFTHATGTILFNSTDAGETVDPGGSPFNALTFASASGGWTILSDATTTGNFALTAASSFTLASSTRLSVGGVFTNLVGGAATTWTGSTVTVNSGTGYTINSKTQGGDVYNKLEIGSSTALRMWDSTGAVTMLDSASSLYSEDHAGVSGSLYIFGNYVRSTGADYWSYATDFDGTALGGSSRDAAVYFAEGASTTITGGTLNIVGASGHKTAISNQGSGTYGLSVMGGTLNASNFSLANMGAAGLSLSGNTTVTSLSQGDFTLAVSGGSLITLSSTTLNFNAGLVSTGDTFATTTAITGYNVNLIGTTPTAWTFTGTSGNFDGEAFDNDGVDDCGSIRWDDSTCLVTSQSAYRWRNDDGGEGVPDSEWYDVNWTKRKRVTVHNADPVSYADATVKVDVPYDADMQADFDDLRFTASDGVTELDHYVESYTASTDAVVWVNVPTLATSTDTTVYMYYGNSGATSGNATTTFPYLDDFEDGDIAEYSGDTTLFTVDGTFAYGGVNGLDATGHETEKATDGVYRTDVTVSQGEAIRFMQYIDTAAGSGDETCTLFGVQSPGSSNQNYAVCLELFGTDRISISKDVSNNDTSGTVLATSTVTYETGWYEVETAWEASGTIAVTLSKDGSVVATTSANDSTYSSGGMGFTFWFQNGGWDDYSARTLLTTEPSVTLGSEQVPGGASWLAALNAPATGVNTGENARVRFLIENSGLPITNQDFELDYAPKGASPSCEAVSYGDYVPVPPSASCGTNDLCMQTSANLANHEATTDLLGGDGTFTPGEAIEDPSNTTNSLDIAQDSYTELEYVVTPTVNVTDSNYCLRVTNAGSDLDQYTRMAELQLVFAPNITSLSLNGGMDIALTGGSTTTVYATGTVSDLNGYTDLEFATTTIFRSGVGESCTPDNNNCYVASGPQCTFTNCSGTSCDVECSADIYFHADPTDVGTFAGETWRAMLAIEDGSGLVATATAPSVDLLTLRAISVDDSIDYGVLAVNSDTGSYNASTTVENIGNDAIDVDVEGTDLTDGGSSAIPVYEQKFATSTFTYSSCVFCSQLSTTTSHVELNLSKPTSTAPAITDHVFWGIAIPFGVAGTPHSGVNTFYAVGD
ncbi:MAG TPA: DUF2341 domain-containing protein [Candidatus Paceibacterota bacterium]|nr:DUF2341 domain-containing protein [Candidatus Paceibacterota bacterium]